MDLLLGVIPRLSHHSHSQLLHLLLHHPPQAKKCQQKCENLRKNLLFFSLFLSLSKPQECGVVGRERTESEEEEKEEEEPLGWFPPALEADLSLQDGTRRNLQ